MYLWNWLDWISRADILLLAAMLAYIAFVVWRGSSVYRRGVREPAADLRALVVDLKQGVRTLQSIATAAPYLGLAGTCFGILESFRGIGMQKAAAMAMAVPYIAASLLTTAWGLIVAFSAASSSSYLLWSANKLDLEMTASQAVARRSSGKFRYSSKYPLRPKFSKMPALALLAAPGLGVALAAFMIFPSFHGPQGLEVRLSQTRFSATGGRPLRPLRIRVLDLGPYTDPGIFLNSKRIPWDDLDDSVGSFLKSSPSPIVNVEAEAAVRWADVALVIDSINSHSGIVTELGVATGSSSPTRANRQINK